MDEKTMQAVRAAVMWLDAHQGTGREQQGTRILKLVEEAGEAARAWIGVIGQNPRHGVTHTVDDVAAELADTALTALVAIESLGLDADKVMNDCISKVLARFDASTAHAAQLDDPVHQRPPAALAPQTVNRRSQDPARG